MIGPVMQTLLDFLLDCQRQAIFLLLSIFFFNILFVWYVSDYIREPEGRNIILFVMLIAYRNLESFQGLLFTPNFTNFKHSFIKITSN